MYQGCHQSLMKFFRQQKKKFTEISWIWPTNLWVMSPNALPLCHLDNTCKSRMQLCLTDSCWIMEVQKSIIGLTMIRLKISLNITCFAWDRQLDWFLDASDANIVNFVLIAKNSKDRNLLKAYVCDISFS